MEAHNELSINNKTDVTCEIEYCNFETLEIKKEMIEDYGYLPNRNVKFSDKRKSQSKVLKGYQTGPKSKIQERKEESAKKYKCQKCARSYKRKESLSRHKKFECDVIPQFVCKFCGKLFKQIDKSNSNWKKIIIKSTKEYQPYFLKQLRKASNDESLKVKEEIVKDYGNLSNRYFKPINNRKYQSNVFTIHQAKRMAKIQETKMESERKYKCDK
ncbi:zinc finger protein 92-like isoform X4 [Belonocnema kinseyi]|nr:zinc finger protein 92-like isoform X4 [Belonocnema kinseyi]